MSAFFITGTDTEVGKTVVTCALLRAAVRAGYRSIGMKPIAAGCFKGIDGLWHNEDVLAHQAASNVSAPLPLRNPYAFELPVSPHIAAERAGCQIDVPLIGDACTQLQAMADLVLVEGAGGVMAPIDQQHNMLDLMAYLRLPVILVVGLRLGCLNHAMLSAAAITERSCRIAGWVANTLTPTMSVQDENIAYLSRHLPGPCLGVLPFISSDDKTVSNQGETLSQGLQKLLSQAHS